MALSQAASRYRVGLLRYEKLNSRDLPSGQCGHKHVRKLSQIPAEASEGSKHPTHFGHNDYRLAAAALLVHTAVIDGNMSDLERGQLHTVIKRQFGLDEATAEWLRRPRPRTRRSISIHQPD
jgi:tellurite resistance protein